MDLFASTQEFPKNEEQDCVDSGHDGNEGSLEAQSNMKVGTEEIRKDLIDRYNKFSPEDRVGDFDFRDAARKFVDMYRKNSKPTTDPLKNKGFLSVMITVTKKASGMDYPLIENHFFVNSDGSGEVQGLTGINKIAREWGLAEKFPKDGGRNNNGSMGQCRAWVTELNHMARHGGRVAHGDLLDYWIKQAEILFSEEPVTVKYNPKNHIREFLDNMVVRFRFKEREWRGGKLLGSMMQHMVGARLQIQLGSELVKHHPVNQSDSHTGRNGDFTIGNSVFHVTSAPTEALIKKCRANCDENLRPIIITLSENTGAARTLSANASIENEVEVIDFESFITTGILGTILANDLRSIDAVRIFVDTYNDLVETHESSNVTKIKFAK